MSDSPTSRARSPAEPPLVAVVDDDPSVLRSLRSLLLSSGFRVQTFQSADAFLDSAQNAAVGCLILDLSMPGMSGGELVSHLGRTLRSVPFVILTAVADPAERERFLHKGAVAFLRKPASGAELLGAIQSALASNRSAT